MEVNYCLNCCNGQYYMESMVHCLVYDDLVMENDSCGLYLNVINEYDGDDGE